MRFLGLSDDRYWSQPAVREAPIDSGGALMCLLCSTVMVRSHASIETACLALRALLWPPHSPLRLSRRRLSKRTPQKAPVFKQSYKFAMWNEVSRTACSNITQIFHFWNQASRIMTSRCDPSLKKTSVTYTVPRVHCLFGAPSLAHVVDTVIFNNSKCAQKVAVSEVPH